MTGEFLCLGLSHHQSPVALRERVGFAREKISEALFALKNQPRIKESFILSTCNRVEIYAYGESDNGLEEIEKFFLGYHALPADFLQPHLYRFKGLKAAEQFFKVAASLDSLIVGEAQILGQVKEAAQLARQANAMGPNLNLMFDYALSAAKRIRSQTEIARHTVSISHIAVELIERVFSSIKGRRTLIVGAGSMAELAGRCLFEKGAELSIVNRTLKNADALSDKFSARAFEINSLPSLLVESDIVLASTNASGFLVSKALVKKVMPKRRYKPLFFVDIAVPRNIDPNIARVDGAYLYNIDDLSSIASSRIAKREENCGHAHLILEEEVARFKSKHAERLAAPLIKEIRGNSFAQADSEVDRLLCELSVELSAEDALKVRQAAYSLVNKLLHQPIMDVKSLAGRCLPQEKAFPHPLFSQPQHKA